ncbi:DedA family protein [Sphingomonas sp. BGYR3]|uniref:DedA family protein n=1 Tax=Sphingomonas sp. BGYR3 TaxID=2975483 RepID=UPI0021A4D437|nr:DedA family protein [Sphingomonas sp. BGYR3]MDG5488208.1 DedA family protein [Sphingomonas sp. BGYR3]
MTDWILDWIAWGGYVAIFLLMALENIVPPVPSEVIMGLGGMAIARGDMSFWPLLIWGTLGTLAGNYWWYWVGRRVGYHRLRPFVERHGRWLTLDWADVERVHHFFLRHGGITVFVFRMLPTFRTMISLPAGMTGMSVWRFSLWTLAGSSVWNAVLIAAGYYLGANFRELDRYVGPIAVAMTVGIIVIYLYRVITWKKED